MVVFVDLDADSYDDAHHHRPGDAGSVLRSLVLPGKSAFASRVKLSLPPALSPSQGDPARADQVDEVDTTASSSNPVESPNLNGFSAALSCYPYGPLNSI
jgi:hypothetical protein